MSRGGVSFVDRKIKCLQALDWWVADLTLQCKYIHFNNFKSYVLSDAIEDSWIKSEDNRYGNGDLSKPKYFSHEKCTQWKYSIYNYLLSW